MGIEPFDKSGDQAEGLYGEKAATAPPKAEPAAKQTKYLAQEVFIGKNITTQYNIKIGDMSATARMNYLRMLDKKREEEEEKKLKILYPKSYMGGKKK